MDQVYDPHPVVEKPFRMILLQGLLWFGHLK
jgi:hypothetical protein